MITITRRQARHLRAVFRRHMLGITHKGLVPPLVFRVDPDAGLRVRHQQTALAVECLVTGDFRPEEAIAIPLDALAEFEGRDDGPVVLEDAAPGRVIARWEDQGIPQTREYTLPLVSSLPMFPAFPVASETCPADLLDALAEAAATTDAGSTRYDLSCLQLRGKTGEVVATDGRQVLIQGGFRMPWEGDVLVAATPLFACRELPRDRPVEVGRTDTHVAIRAGAYTLWLTIRDARFPRVEHAIPAADAPATRLRLAIKDAEFLARALDRLPGGESVHAPVTVDLNGRVAVRAQATGGSRITELILGRSGFTGASVRLVTSRCYLARALRLGFADVRVGGPEEPVSCRDGRRAYLWQPLSADGAIAPSDDMVCIESTGTDPVPRTVGPMAETIPASRSSTEPSATTTGTGGLGALIQEAAALHDVLADAKARALRLTGALRRHRKQSRLTSATLAALRHLNLQEAVE